jgi:hypothetical protein
LTDNEVVTETGCERYGSKHTPDGEAQNATDQDRDYMKPMTSCEASMELCNLLVKAIESGVNMFDCA